MPGSETVLIIDDRRDNVTFLRENVLDPAGCQVLVAGDGQEGLRRTLEEQPDLIILDLTVPKMSGWQILEELRSVQNNAPVILMTFHGTEETAVRAYQLGVREYIIQPYTVEQMRAAVERSLVEGRLRSERDQLVRGIALSNSRVERRLRELSVLAGIGRSITALLDEDRLLTRVVDAAVYLTRAEEGFLLLVDEGSGELYMRAARGAGEKVAREFRLKVSDSLAGQVVQTGRPVIVSGSRQEDRLKIKTGYLVRSLLHVPLKVGESVIGVLSVDHMFEQGEFSAYDLQLLGALADYTAIALEHARLGASLQAGMEVGVQAGVPDTEPVSSPVHTVGAIEPVRAARLQGVLDEIALYREQVRTCIQSAQTTVTDLRKQALSLETRLADIASEEKSLSGPEIDSGLDLAAGATRQAGWRYEINAILDSMVDGFMVVDYDDRIVMANRMASQMLGHSVDELRIDGVCDDPRWSKTYYIVKAAAQLQVDVPGSELTSATTALSVGQKMLRASFRVKPASSHVPAGVVVVLRDITAEREAQRAKDSFVSSVSQELRTPMTSIVGYADLLLSGSAGTLGGSQTRFMDRIRSNAQQIESLLNELAGMVVLDSRQLQVNPEMMDLQAAIHEASGTMRAQMAERGQLIKLSLDPNLPYIEADPDAIYHILTNLLQNAHRCSPRDARIVLRAEKMQDGDDLYVAISVADSGGGIRPDDYRRVFNRFYRLDSPMVEGLGDPGVNLPIVKVLVEANGGRLWLDTQPGAGSTFTLVLPVRRETPSQVAGYTL
jgi:PAS domain S-box-containing protein